MDKGGNFERRKHHHFGEKGFEQTPQVKARRGGAKQDGRGLRDLIPSETLEAVEYAPHKRGLQSGAGGGRSLRGKGAVQFLFDGVIEGEHAQRAIVREQWTNQGAAERLPRRFDEQDGMFGRGRGIKQGLKNASKIADRDLLAQELLQNFLDLAKREYFGDKFLDELGMAVAEPVEEPLGFL